MGKIKNEYKSFLEDIEKNLKNKEEIEYVKERFEMLINERNTNCRKGDIDKLIERQNAMEEKLERIQTFIDNIERDIYSSDGFDFEVICPYCDYGFVVDMDDNKTEIICPECENTIELDWSGDLDEEDGCNGSCHGCHGCKDDDDDM